MESCNIPAEGDSIVCASEKGYADVKGLRMYYEIYGKGTIPLVLLHGGGSTIETSFGAIIPYLCGQRKVIAVELQAHGRTSDRDTDLSFEQDADDVAALLEHLGIPKADFLGFSNGGTTTLQIAIRHPRLVNKVILASALAKRDGMPHFFWDFMKQAHIDQMPVQLKEAYLKVAPDKNGLQNMHDRDAKRMVGFKDIPDESIKEIQSPALVMTGDRDVVIPEHAIQLSRLLPNARLAILPGTHGEYIGEVTTLKAGLNTEPAGLRFILDFITADHVVSHRED